MQINRINWKWILVVLSVLVPAALLFYDNTLYANPLVAFLLSLLIAFLSVIASRSDMLGEVKNKTQTELTCPHILYHSLC